MDKPCILIMAGGTGGHVFPALAVAHALQKKGWLIHWLGTKEGLEAQIIPKENITLHTITVKGLRRRGIGGWILAPFSLLRALWQAIRILRQLRPRLVLGGGGFVSGPGGVAAWLLGYPLVIHEQNSIVGLTNQLLSFVADQTLESFPHSFPKGRRAIYTGNPIREALMNLPTPEERLNGREGPLRLLVLGGSRGALALNEICPKAVSLLPVDKRPQIWHQTGDKHSEPTLKAYQDTGLTAQVEPFIQDMAGAYHWADLVFCRAGAMTVGELAVVGVGSILVPFPFAVDDHQTSNARFLEQEGAAYLIPQSDLTKEKLADLLLTLSRDRGKLLEMAKAAHCLAKPDAVLKVVTYCEEISKRAAK